MFNRGFDKEYYRQWKQTYSEAEQNDAVESLIADRIDEAAREHSSYLRYVGEIYIEEQMWDRLFELVQADNNLHSLLQYHKYLAKRYPKEMAALYIPNLKSLGNKVEGRSQYADFAEKLKLVLKDIPEAQEPMTALVNELIAKKPRRPAMIDELSKVIQTNL